MSEASQVNCQNIAHLKKTCEECTRSKVRCSGPESTNQICDRCRSRKTECVFRCKKKRGPPPGSSHLAKKQEAANARPPVDKGKKSKAALGSETLPLMSWHERRCYNVFFAIFKNQTQTEMGSLSWCWYALQVDHLKRDLEFKKNLDGLTKLNAFMDSTQTKLKVVEPPVEERCHFAPHLCSYCASAGVAPPLSPASTSSSGTGTSPRLMQLHGDDFFHHEHNHLPFIHVEIDATHAEVLVNAQFTNTFGYTKANLDESMAWSKGAFMPWGGDVFARLLWSEAELISLLASLALRFKTAVSEVTGDGKRVREIPTVCMPEIRVFQGTDREPQEKIITCVLKVLVRETYVSDQELRLTLLAEFQPLGSVKDAPLDEPATVQENATQTRALKKQLNDTGELLTEQGILLKLEDDERIDLGLDLVKDIDWRVFNTGETVEQEDDTWLDSLLDWNPADEEF